MTTTAIHVVGMTCQHCVNAVTDELNKLPTVQHVAVDLPSGQVVVTSGMALEAAAVSAAIDEAGYSLAP